MAIEQADKHAKIEGITYTKNCQAKPHILTK